MVLHRSKIRGVFLGVVSVSDVGVGVGVGMITRQISFPSHDNPPLAKAPFFVLFISLRGSDRSLPKLYTLCYPFFLVAHLQERPPSRLSQRARRLREGSPGMGR